MMTIWISHMVLAEARNIDDGDKQVNKTGEMKNGTVEEGASMHDSDNQNTPTPGVGEIGDNQPFDGEKGKQIDEGIDDLGGEGEDPIGDDLGADGGEDPILVMKLLTMRLIMRYMRMILSLVLTQWKSFYHRLQQS